MPASSDRVQFDSDQSAIWAAASFTDRSMTCPAPVACCWISAHSMAKTACIDAVSSAMLPGGSRGSRSGTPALKAMPAVASITAHGTSRPA